VKFNFQSEKSEQFNTIPKQIKYDQFYCLKNFFSFSTDKPPPLLMEQFIQECVDC